MESVATLQGWVVIFILCATYETAIDKWSMLGVSTELCDLCRSSYLWTG